MMPLRSLAMAEADERPFLSFLSSLRSCMPPSARRPAHCRQAGAKYHVRTPITEADQRFYWMVHLQLIMHENATMAIHLEKETHNGSPCGAQLLQAVPGWRTAQPVPRSCWGCRQPHLPAVQSGHHQPSLQARQEHTGHWDVTAGMQVRPPGLASGCPRPAGCHTCTSACMCPNALFVEMKHFDQLNNTRTAAGCGRKQSRPKDMQQASHAPVHFLC